ncbi:MAG: GldG family protein [Candidatus Brocadiia bacterium]
MEEKQATTTGMTPTSGSDQGWGRKQRVWTALNVVVMVIIATAILFGVNWWSSRHYVRFDLTFKQNYSLSDKTKNILRNLKEPVTLYTFFFVSDRDTGEIQAKIADLFEEYKIYGGKNFILEELKPAQSPEMVEIMKQKLKMETLTPNDMIFRCGDRQKNINVTETYEREQSSPYGEPGRIKTFKGEESITAAILSVTQSRRPTVYFTTGHKEPDIDNPYPENFATINAHIKRENIDTKALKLLDKTEVPADCDLLVIASPQERFTAAEQQMFNSYLQKGGRAIVLLDPVMDSGLDGVLKEWGVKLGDGVIFDTDQCVLLFGGMKEPSCIIANTFGNHTVTSRMGDQDAGVFIMTRPVELESGAAGGIELVKTGPNSWVEMDLEGLSKRKAPKFDKDIDRKGPVSVAVAITREVAGQAAVEQSAKKETRLVVIGDSDHLKNKFISGDSPLYMGKIDIFMNSLRWMLGNEVMISIEPKKAESTKIEMTSGRASFLFWFSVVILPLLGAALGIFMWVMRRS